MSSELYDYLLIGGGLQNALIAQALLTRSPEVRLCLVEKEQELGGNHLWCFHSADVSTEGGTLVDPLVIRRWPGYGVRFPRLERRLASPYAAISSERLAEVVRGTFAHHPSSRLIFGRGAHNVHESGAHLSDGEEIRARVVIDARGPEAHPRAGVLGYQKFVGLELELEQPTTLDEPVVMDATVPQSDGFRFVYTLPFSSTRVLVEDTYFSDDAALDRPALRARALAYARAAGFGNVRIIREESGILPLPARTAAPRSGSPLVAGYAGGWFHPTTGYSLPVAVRLALHIAGSTPETLFDARFDSLVREHTRQQRYAFLLNRLLFEAVPEGARRNVLERFYRLPEASIARFYALSTTGLDRARIICGRPPRGLSIGRALTEVLLQ